MANSKKKGNRGELAICKVLSEHFEQKFNRVPASGAISTIHKLSSASNRTLAGDIICPDNFSFSIENKFGYEVDLYNLFRPNHNHKSLFFEFMRQAEEDASKIPDVIPMVIYTRTRKKPLIIMPLEGHQKESKIKELAGILDQHLEIRKNGKLWMISDLEEVLSKFPKSFFFD